MEKQKEKVFVELLDALNEVTDKFNYGVYNDLIEKAEKLIGPNDTIKEYVNITDSLGHKLYVNCNVKSPNFNGTCDLMQLRKDEDGRLYYYNWSDRCEYGINFVGAAEISLM